MNESVQPVKQKRNVNVCVIYQSDILSLWNENHQEQIALVTLDSS